MPHTRLASEEISRRGQAIYDNQLWKIVETPENIGKQMVIDVETEDYEIDDDGMAASRRLREKNPDGAFYGVRIGYNAVYAIGGVLTRIKR